MERQRSQVDFPPRCPCEFRDFQMVGPAFCDDALHLAFDFLCGKNGITGSPTFPSCETQNYVQDRLPGHARFQRVFQVCLISVPDRRTTNRRGR